MGMSGAIIPLVSLLDSYDTLAQAKIQAVQAEIQAQNEDMATQVQAFETLLNNTLYAQAYGLTVMVAVQIQQTAMEVIQTALDSVNMSSSLVASGFNSTGNSTDSSVVE